eukprot:6043291-Prorocentrum_lima.AAC.1
MTSSLVGSEMCIRDRRLDLHIVVDAGLSGQTVSFELPDDFARVLQQAVSYTHLTLPTICSV